MRVIRDESGWAVTIWPERTDTLEELAAMAAMPEEALAKEISDIITKSREEYRREK